MKKLLSQLKVAVLIFAGCIVLTFIAAMFNINLATSISMIMTFIIPLYGIYFVIMMIKTLFQKKSKKTSLPQQSNKEIVSNKLHNSDLDAEQKIKNKNIPKDSIAPKENINLHQTKDLLNKPSNLKSTKETPSPEELLKQMGVAVTLQPINRNYKKSSKKPNVLIHHLRRKLYNFVVVDTETTGLNRESSKVIQLSAIKYINDKPVDTFNTFINPGNLPLPEKISIKTGINDEQLINAPKFSDITNDFSAFVGTLPWIGHNINSFDIPIIVNNGLDLNEVSTIDTLKLSHKKLTMKHYTLENLKDYFNINNRSHNALEDCKTTAIVYQKLRDDQLTEVKKDYSAVPKTISGLKFAISGTFPGYSRKDIQNLITAHGGIIKSNVTHDTDYLIDGKQTSDILTDGVHSGKELKAQNYGTKVLNLAEFLSLINNKDNDSYNEMS